ncbi:hypothetical protein B0H17DRAFT_1140690 [Mycena rosella]|uniref:Uncharacterized protein n=1 Tax=Mycena rosella TaxID=1033263 RepID=A0AAD7G9V8_MYCRO|nr:hypothetical protein B0H17DRAFT_1140690 [Mycena rosella]
MALSAKATPRIDDTDSVSSDWPAFKPKLVGHRTSPFEPTLMLAPAAKELGSGRPRISYTFRAPKLSGSSFISRRDHSVALPHSFLFGAVSQPFMVLAPKYSENWFDLRGRTAATMAISVANPVGGAIAQVICPQFASIRQSILGLAYSGSNKSPSLLVLVKALLERETTAEFHMELRERVDFAVLLVLFGTLVATSRWEADGGHATAMRSGGDSTAI